MIKIGLVVVCTAVLLVSAPASGAPGHDPHEQGDQAIAARVTALLHRTPLIDGHNDLPWEIRERFFSRPSPNKVAAPRRHALALFYKSWMPGGSESRITLGQPLPHAY